MFFSLLLIFKFFSDGLAETNFRIRLNQTNSEYTSEDVSAEIQLGKALDSRMLYAYKLVDDAEAQNYVNMVGAYVAAHIGRPELDYYFAIVESKDINAYAVPGGYIFITSQAFKEAKSAVALIGILAHEMGHVNLRHTVKALKIRGRSLAFEIGAAMSGFQSQSIQKVLEASLDAGIGLLFKAGLSEKDEKASDAYAAKFLHSKNLSIDPYIDVFKRIKEEKLPIKIMSRTHPSLETRIRLLEKYKYKGGKSLKAEDENLYQSIANRL
jgi:beta-barrel assembly-enhancing protease